MEIAFSKVAGIDVHKRQVTVAVVAANRVRRRCVGSRRSTTVSYTHLDVYKRQAVNRRRALSCDQPVTSTT